MAGHFFSPHSHFVAAAATKANRSKNVNAVPINPHVLSQKPTRIKTTRKARRKTPEVVEAQSARLTAFDTLRLRIKDGFETCLEHLQESKIQIRKKYEKEDYKRNAEPATITRW